VHLVGNKLIYTHYKLICSVLLSLHINFCPEQHLTDCLFHHVFHVTPATSATSYQKLKCLINANITG